MSKYKKLTVQQFRDQVGTRLEGHIVEFDPPLYIYGYKKTTDGSIPIFPKVQTKESIGKLVKVTGGFGASLTGMGRMIMFDEIFQSIEDVENNKPIRLKDENGEELDVGGNTKEYPSAVWVIA